MRRDMVGEGERAEGRPHAFDRIGVLDRDRQAGEDAALRRRLCLEAEGMLARPVEAERHQRIDRGIDRSDPRLGVGENLARRYFAGTEKVDDRRGGLLKQAIGHAFSPGSRIH